MQNYLTVDINYAYFIDSLLNQVKARKEALLKVRTYLQDKIELINPEEDNYNAIKTIKELFNDIHYVLQ